MAEGLVGHYNATFINTSSNGTYNVTIYANKTGYVNDTAELSFEISTPVHNLNTGLNYTTIQAAIDAAETKDGHTIQVDARTYYENVLVDKQLNLTGIGMPTVAAGENGSAITVAADGCLIDGFNVTGSISYPNAGITVQSNNNSIRNNTASSNNQGIILWRSENNTVVGNIASYNEDGICLSVYSQYNIISNNIVNKNEGGICMRASSFNTLNDNIIENNDGGIFLHDSYHNIIKGNTVNSNNNRGISLDYSNNNLVYHNNLINNTKQAYSDGYNNRWDNGYPTGGNYWSDHTCNGNPSCGNHPYYIWENGLDHYPFQEPDGWLIPYEEHDLVVTNITAPGSVYVNSTTSIYSTIYNVRLNNESNITVNFLVDGVNQSNTTISYIGSKASKDVSFEWAAPCYVGNHTLTIYAEPVVNESIVWNNLLDKNISVIKKEIIYVDDDFEDDPENHTWNTIQEGIVDAKNGDIVFVYNGTYYENVVVDKTINLTGEDEDTTIIDGGGNGDVIKVAADQVNINGFSIKNSEERNAGVDISSHNNITVAYCNIFNNRIGINLYGCSDITISDCGITNNDYVGISGWVCASNNIQISNSSISDNSAEGIHIWGASISITNCTIADNEGEKSGPCAGVYLETSYDSQITNCTISNNTWAGIYISGYDASNNCIIHCDIHSNSGPGIRFWSGGTNSTIADCCIYSNDNHGIELRSFTTITNCIISNNYGCGIYTEVGANQILGCNIHSNYENGIHFEATGVSHNQVANCKCSDNENGIYIGNVWGSQNYEITGCKILNNDCGINILRSGSKIINCDIVNNNEGIVGEESDNIIYRNNIINNEQAVDTGNNLWDNGSAEGGNYWSDHKCTGNPSNGSQPYHIDADNIDNFPFEDANGWLPEKQPPVASFLHSPQYPENPVVNQTIIFDASSSYDIGGTIVSYEWNFGDGTTGTGEIVNHSYSDAEDYLVTLTVTDDDAAIDTDMTVITIWPIPKLIYVDNDFEDNPISHKWNTIQEGIDDANSGDTVFVYSGTYYENVVIDKNVINLVGENKVNTIIDGSIRDGIWINADWISISKFRINSSTYSGITISSANNRITNCILSNNDKGISLGGDNNCVENCTVSNSNEHGISLYYDSQNNIVTNCTISSNGQSKSYPGHGIYFEGSTYNKIISCNISENKDDGIRLVGSSDNKITNCDIYSNNKNGISLVGGYHGSSSNNNVSYCSIYLNDQIGIQIRGSPNNLFRNNALWDNIYNLNVDGSDQDIDLSNTINEKPIFYLVEESNLIINGVTDDVGYLGLVSCNNITAKNLKLSHNYHGLLLAGTTNTTIENCDISNNNDGIYLCRYSSHNNISNSITSDNTCGIHFYGNGPSNTVTNCDILNNSKEGIYFDLNSGGGEVTNCTISNNGQGIHIDSWTINKIG
jgi:parallel beta-helix repeat protein